MALYIKSIENLINEFKKLPGIGPKSAKRIVYYLLKVSPKEISRFSQALARRVAGFTGFWLKYLDYYLINKPGAYDAGSAFFFLGRKRDGYVLGDKELLELYRGLQM